MKKFLLCAVAILGSIALIYAEEMASTDDTDWIFALSILILFALFLLGWKRWNPGGASIIVATAFMLLSISSIFLLDPAGVLLYSFLIGLLLIPFYRRYKDVTITSMAFVLEQLLVYIGFDNSITIWMLFLVNGFLALAGSYLGLKWLRRCFTVFFSMSAVFLVFMNSFNEGKLLIVIILAAIALIGWGIYRFSRPEAGLRE